MMTPAWPSHPDTSGVGPDPVEMDGLVAEQVWGLRERASAQWSVTGSADAAMEQGYARYEAVELVFVEMESAATSPFMDS